MTKQGTPTKPLPKHRACVRWWHHQDRIVEFLDTSGDPWWVRLVCRNCGRSRHGMA